MKILKELRKAIDRNADYCKKKLEGRAKKNYKIHLQRWKLS